MENDRHKKIRTLLVYQAYRDGVRDFYEDHIRCLRDSGFDVEGFCLTINPPGPRFGFSELDTAWKRKNGDLMAIYGALIERAREKDAIVLYNGANLHPELLPELGTFNAFMCFDDPESSDDLSRPVARFFDACFVGNIASIAQYQSWGCKNIFFRPLSFFRSNLYSDRIDSGVIANRDNTVDACFFGERMSPWRRERLDYLESHIPNLYARGRGWKGGWVSDDEMLAVYGRSRIGINVHNSTGPINLRTYALPANGVMQICDNKYFLGHIFELGREVIGFGDIEEVPSLVDYYLKHEGERLKIAVAGHARAVRDYNEVAVWDRQMRQIANLT